jgi:hypothetical protein
MARPRLNLRRYHNKIHFPENTALMCLEFFGQIGDVDVTYHAAEQLMEDRRTIIPLPSREELLHDTNTLVEMYELCDDWKEPLGKLQKILIRVHNLHDQYDFAYVLAREGFIVSAWANDKDDDHRLDGRAAREYWRPPGMELPQAE